MVKCGPEPLIYMFEEQLGVGHWVGSSLDMSVCMYMYMYLDAFMYVSVCMRLCMYLYMYV